MNTAYAVGDVVRVQYRTRDLPFLAVVSYIELRPGYRYVGWTRQLIDQSPIGGWCPFAGQFGALRDTDGHGRILHP